MPGAYAFNLEADIMRNITGTESYPIDLTIVPNKDFTFTSPSIADTFENEFMWIAGIVGGIAVIALVGVHEGSMSTQASDCVVVRTTYQPVFGDPLTTGWACE